jgi:two-component system LytT family response regulator
MKALIIDDERLARKELSTLLEKHDGIHVVGEAANADEAPRWKDSSFFKRFAKK